MGRPAKSLFEHVLNGTTPKAALHVESVITGALPRPPKFLSKEAKKKFRGLVKQLAERRAVTQGDTDLITIYCRTFMRWIQASESVDKEGIICSYERLDKDGKVHVVERPNISLKIVETTERAMLSYLTKLGLTPKDREHVRPTALVETSKQPPHPDSREGMALDAERLRAQIAAEKERNQEGDNYVDDGTSADDDEA